MVAQPLHEIPASLLREGRAMLHALASDWILLPDWDVCVCWDTRLSGCPIANAIVQPIDAHELFLDAWRKLANEVDYVLVIAPEIDNQLVEITNALRRSRACLLNADSLFLETASDKWLTAQALHRANLPHPKTERVGDFINQAKAIDELGGNAWTIKPRDGAGCHELLRFASLDDVRMFIKESTPMIHHWNRYLIQPWIDGISGSVAVLCGPNQLCVLPAMSQNISLEKKKPRSEVLYLGGTGPLQGISPTIINDFAKRVIQSLPSRPLGWLGIDFVVTDSESADKSIFAIEVNPRLTTSYLGLREVISENLAGLLFQASVGQDTGFSLSGRSTTFDSFGMSTHN